MVEQKTGETRNEGSNVPTKTKRFINLRSQGKTTLVISIPKDMLNLVKWQKGDELFVEVREPQQESELLFPTGKVIRIYKEERQTKKEL